METRINKYLSEAGVCSRRAADLMIEEGRVTVDGVPAQMGAKVLDGQCVCVDGKPISKEEEQVILLFHKPVGIVCTAEKREKNNVIDYLGYPKRIYPVGRLDKDSEGLLLLTNDGDLMNRILKAANGHEKEYIVTVDKKITPEFIRGMSGGVPVLERMTNPCPVTEINEHTFNIVLTQGLNRQIRRMCEYFGYSVVKLKRIRIMNLRLDGIRKGEYRSITDKERMELEKMIKRDSEV
ncbi:MAG: pseudouridine synthase [Lachnospiraceae bacterium]